jgi:Zn finger protein HypA/HybF involved in hydrogenase expression
MGAFGLFGKESYYVECAHCDESLAITREEVEAGRYTCPVCNGASSVPDHIRAEHKKKREQEELRRQEKERKKKEREARRAQHKSEAQQERAARERARQEQLERIRQKQASRNASLHAGQCPDCGGELQVLEKGYDSGTGLACCCLAGPLGLLGGLLGSGEKTRVCKGCGREFRFGS